MLLVLVLLVLLLVLLVLPLLPLLLPLLPLLLIEIICCNSFEKLVGVKFPIKEARLGTRTILFCCRETFSVETHTRDFFSSPS